MQTLFTDLVTLIQSSWLNDVDAATYNALSAVSGTNTIVGTGPTTVTAYAANQRFFFTPANTNSGAATLNISSIGPKNIFWNGVACTGGELRQNIPVLVMYDGVQFHILARGFNAATAAEVNAMTSNSVSLTPNSNKIVLGTEQETTSGTAIDFTGIPAGVRRITVNLSGVSTNGTGSYFIQIGDSGGIETTGYVSAAGHSGGDAGTTGGFIVTVNGVAAATYSGSIILSLQDSSDFTWNAIGLINGAGGAVAYFSAGVKSLSAELTQVRLTTSAADTFDLGVVNINYER